MPDWKSDFAGSAPGSAPDRVPRAVRRQAVGVCVLLAVAVFLVFGRTVWYPFVNFDDDLYCYANPHVQAGLTWDSLKWALTTGYDAIWHPLTWISHMLDVELFGPGPAGPHLINVLLHAATVLLLFSALWRMIGALWPSAFVAAVFAIHPLRVESVAWVADRKDLLSGLFFMLMLGAYARYAQTRSKAERRESKAALAPPLSHPMGEGARRTGQGASHPVEDGARLVRRSPASRGEGGRKVEGFAARDYWFAILFFALGLMSKPMLVTAPLVLLLLDWWPLGRLPPTDSPGFARRAGQLLLEKIPFLVLAALCSWVTLSVQIHGLARIDKIPLDQRLCNAVTTCFIYLGKMFYPFHLAVFYPYSARDMAARIAALGLVALIGLCLAFFRLRRRQPWLLCGWLWYLVMLLPVAGLIKVEAHARADRYTYLPHIGVCLLVTWAVKEWFPTGRNRRQILGGAAFLVLAALIAVASIQTASWRSSEAVWTHALACASPNYVAHNNLALVRVAQGRLKEAADHFREALAINPRFTEAHNNYGLLLAQQGQSTQAVRQFQSAIELQPDFAEAHNNLGNVLAAERRFPEAIAQYQAALKIKPDYAEAACNLGNTLAQQGRYAEAIPYFERALRINPAYLNARNSLDAAMSLQYPPAKGKPKQ